MGPGCSPRSGLHLALTDWNQDDTTSLFIIDEGKPARAILNRKEVLLSPHWSPNGWKIVFGMGRFVRFAGAEKSIDPKHGADQVGMVNANGSEFDVNTSGPNNNAFPSFSPDGKRIVYRTTGPDGEGLRIMNIEDHSVTVLTNFYDNFPVWSPRGDLIEFTRKVGQDFEVFTIQQDGKNVTQLTHTHGNDTHASWSPDEERIVFTSSRMGFKDEAL